MNMQQEPREASPRAIEGALALSPSSRGRSTAPHLFVWLPILAKVAAAAGAALVLAVIGAKAGAHRPTSDSEPAASAAPPVLAAALVAGGPSAPTTESPTPAADDAGTAEPSPVAGPAAGGGLLPDGRVVLNDATEADLTKLPGIGPSRAQAILALRQRLKRFRAVEDLLRVKGIGRKMLRRLRPSVVLDRPSVDAQATPASTAVGSPRAEDSGATER